MMQLQDFIESADIGMAIVDSQGLITASNKALRISLIQYCGSDLVFGEDDLYSAFEIPPFQDQNQDVQKTRKGDLTLRITRKKMQLDGQDFKLIQVQDLSAEAKQMREMHRYTSDMLIRVRSKITPIQNAMTLFLDYPNQMSPEEVEQLFGMSSAELWQLERWIDALRDMSQLNTGHMDDLLQIGKHSLDRLLQSACNDVKRSFSHTTQLILFELDFPREIIVNIDGPRVIRILGGILLNAVQHSPSGKAIRISAKVEGHHVVIQIKDQGQGIPPQDQNRIFEYGFRSTKKSSSSDAGLGTDLWLARSLLCRMDASIQFESSFGVGTTFTLQLPVHYG